MAQVRAERRAARLEEARLLRVAKRRQQETEDQRQTGFHAQQSRNYNRLAFRCNPADDYSLSPLIDIMTEVCYYCKALKFNGETKGMCCAVGKIKLSQLEEPPELFLTGYTAESKPFLSKIKNTTRASK
ncbi:unnamed protein product [Onchocerca ochengi]|uniref:Spt4 domain-containing protein n=1 Tax=Onchocerca ochengi TaxID=42157 RepID=A0A182EPJ7_ONCOC|nr:unnamed protein product [Onchocerca ochengi]